MHQWRFLKKWKLELKCVCVLSRSVVSNSLHGSNGKVTMWFNNSTTGRIPEKPKALIQKDTCTPMFIEALFAITEKWKQSKCPVTDEWIKKMWDVYTIKYSVQFSLSVMFNSLWPHESQHARPPCPSPTCRVYSNSCPTSQWCHPTISSSVVPFSRLQSFLASGYFQMSQFFTSGGQSIGVSVSASVLSMNIEDWFPLGWTGWISLQSKELSRVFSKTTVQKHQLFSAQLSL